MVWHVKVVNGNIVLGSLVQSVVIIPLLSSKESSLTMCGFDWPLFVFQHKSQSHCVLVRRRFLPLEYDTNKGGGGGGGGGRPLPTKGARRARLDLERR